MDNHPLLPPISQLSSMTAFGHSPSAAQKKHVQHCHQKRTNQIVLRALHRQVTLQETVWLSCIGLFCLCPT